MISDTETPTRTTTAVQHALGGRTAPLFITGSESFIGKALTRRCVALGIPHVRSDNVTTTNVIGGPVCWDIRNEHEQPTIPEGATVVHLAALSTDKLCAADPKLAFDVNVSGALNVARAAKRAKASQFIFASTEWVYGNLLDGLSIDETYPTNIFEYPSQYAYTKAAAERNLTFISDLENITTLRLSIVYGPNHTQNRSAPEQIFETIKNGETVEVGSLKTARRYIHVEDVVSAILASVGRTGHETFNISGDQLVTLKDLIDASADVLRQTVKYSETDPTRYTIRNLNNSKARRLLGWRPEYDLAAGLRTLL